MEKQELAESMAEFLGWKYSPANSNCGHDLWVSQDGNKHAGCWNPDGFFAVWDKLEEIEMYGGVCQTEKDMYEVQICSGDYDGTKPAKFYIEHCGPNRYIAFYEAVHEMKTSNEKVLNEQG